MLCWNGTRREGTAVPSPVARCIVERMSVAGWCCVTEVLLFSKLEKFTSRCDETWC